MVGRTLHRLSPRRVVTVTTRGFHADGGGLYLQVAKGGSKSWVFRFKTDGRDHWHGLGSVRAISLAEARERAAECRRLRANDIDPIVKRRSERTARRLETANALTFKVAAERFVAAHRSAWRNAKHAGQWEATLATYAYPVFGDLPVASVDTGLVLRALEAIWSKKPETASRLRQRIERVLSWATARGYRKGENPARWRGHLDQTLPARNKMRGVAHHAALDYRDIGTFMAKLRSQVGIGARALEFAILTAARTGEAIGARWNEFDLDAKIWAIPAERMKAHREHRVPLSEPALAVLRALQDVREGPFVFPGGRRGRPLSNMALLKTLRRMGRGDLTTHGFRSTFRDWAAETTSHPSEVVEMALAHAVGDKVEAAYRRGDLFDKRRALMEDWAFQAST
jgi:integrase